MSNELPWSERVNAIAVNPDMASRDDIAKLASELGEATRLLRHWEAWEANMIIDGTEKWIETISQSSMDAMIKLQIKRNEILGRQVE